MASFPKRAYKKALKVSIVGCGGVAVVGLSQQDSDKLIRECLDAGVNYFDVAPAYGKNGEAEEKFGRALEHCRKKVFLACKTICRDAAGSRKELETSLTHLRTDHLDLYQFHALNEPKDIEQVLGPAGAMETFIQARRQGLVRFIGFSSHNESTAVELLQRFEFDSVMFPVNFVCYAQNGMGAKLIEAARRRNVARVAIKMFSAGKLPKGTKNSFPNCWYKVVDDPETAELAFRFTLSQDITVAIPSGDARCVRWCLDFAPRFRPINADERQALLARASGAEAMFA